MNQAQVTNMHTVYVGKDQAGIYWQNVLPGNSALDRKWEGERFAKAGGAYLIGLYDTEEAVAAALNASIAATH